MPRYHFDIWDDGADIDADGSELADATAARKSAIVMALDASICRPPIDGSQPAVVTVRDAAGRTIHTVWVQIHEERHG